MTAVPVFMSTPEPAGVSAVPVFMSTPEPAGVSAAVSTA